MTGFFLKKKTSKLYAALRNSDVGDASGLGDLIEDIGRSGGRKNSSSTSPPPFLTPSPAPAAPASPPPPPPTAATVKFVKNVRKVQRSGALTQSFRRMADAVHLRPKDGPSSRLGGRTTQEK